MDNFLVFNILPKILFLVVSHQLVVGLRVPSDDLLLHELPREGLLLTALEHAPYLGFLELLEHALAEGHLIIGFLASPVYICDHAARFIEHLLLIGWLALVELNIRGLVLLQVKGYLPLARDSRASSA